MILFSKKQAGLVACLSILALTSACDTARYDELQATEATAGEFSKALKQEYSAFTKSEIDQQDWPDQHYFAKKGLLAAKGAQPLPEQPKNWGISKANQSHLDASRADLIHWLNTDARFKNPARSARAQASFDCWVEQKEENWQTEHIEACRQGVTRTLPKMAQVNFAFDQYVINDGSRDEIRKIALDWHNNPGQGLTLQGHTDQIGKKSYNYALSKRRAEAVKRSLLAFGVPKDQIHIELWGEIRPREELSNDNKARSNRRVEILKY